MHIGIMQPYFFPYIGYFQLINLVDKFILYDDVNYINKGWINRNNILINGKGQLFTIPLQGASQNKRINEIHIQNEINWKQKFTKTIKNSYSKSPFFNNIYPLLEDILSNELKNISDFNLLSIRTICNYLDINTIIIESSSIYNNDELKGQNRIIDICLKENALQYINPIGGTNLYNKEDFTKQNLSIKFIKTKDIHYQQYKNDFVPFLSIIDVIMFNSKTEVKNLLNQYELI